ncbi:NTP transferase domain-containing protein [Ornithinimicrobium sufpigmenti]|uniref:NTP transferase domain-containing protein n=1 Tax=Ornithinimicrobium sufpigmenti TaxID=2508882 RepID=UPI0010360B2F|nr:MULTISPECIES: NTP transferase domain-containing protein [unclassified Ornithinimicrobium]
MTGAPQAQPGGVRWSLVVPVQDASRAKSRLAPPHPLSRPDLARAVARDTLEQVCRALPPEQVTVVTSDASATRVAQDLGTIVVVDPGHGLNGAIRAGLRAAQAAQTARARVTTQAGGAVRSPRPTERAAGWAVLLGDLPALQPHELVAALATCAAHAAAIVPDADGTGTVLLTSTTTPPEPAFGAGSAARHQQRATRLELDLPGLRRDVDTATDLATALELGVGRHTARTLAPLGWATATDGSSWPSVPPAWPGAADPDPR